MGPSNNMADPFPLYLPPETRRLFQSESLLRRFAQMAHWNDGPTWASKAEERNRCENCYNATGGCRIAPSNGSLSWTMHTSRI